MTARKSRSKSAANKSRSKPTAKKRRALVVLGMHRSGTSALTRMLGLLGATLPKHQMPATESNPRGYFESQKLFELHEELMREAGTSWFDLAPFPADWVESPLADSWIERLADACVEEFGDSPFFVVKDPRMVRLLPVWSRVFERLEIEPSYVLAIRNPLDVAASLHRAQQTDESKGLLLWLQYFLAAEYQTRGSPRCFHSYEALLDDWRGVAADISKTLHIVFPRRSRRAEAEIDAFLTTSLQHQSTTTAQVFARRDVVDWVKDAYRWACDAASGKTGSARTLDRIRTSFEAVEAACGPLIAKVELDRARSDRRADQLESRVVDLNSALTESQREAATLAKSLDVSREELAARGNEVAEIRDQLVAHEHEGSRLVEVVKFVLEAALGRLDEAATSELAVAYDGGVLAPLAETGVQLSLRAGEVESLRGDVARLREQVSSVEEIERMKHEASERNAALSRLSTEVGGLRDSVSRRDTRIEQLKEETAASARELGGRETRIGELEQELQRTTAAAEISTRESTARQTELESARDDLASLHENLGARDARISALEEDLANSASESASRALELDRLGNQLRATEAELAKARSDLAEFETRMRALEQDLEHSLAQVDRDTGAIAKLTIKLRESEAAVAKAADDMAERDRIHQDRIASLEGDVQQSASEAATHAQALTVEKTQRLAQQAEIERKTRELARVRAELEQMETQLSQTRNEIADREFCVRELRSQLDAMPKARRRSVMASLVSGS